MRSNQLTIQRGWVITAEGERRPRGSDTSQARAIASAWEILKQTGGEIKVLNDVGKIELEMKVHPDVPGH